MTIHQGFTDSFKLELLEGVHDFTVDVIKIALYSSDASLLPSTTTYSSTNEVVGTGYSAGGATLTASTGTTTQSDSGRSIAYVDFADVSWLSSTITARGALIYNSSKANRSIMALNFGIDRVSSSSTFPIVFPTPDFLNALIRLG